MWVVEGLSPCGFEIDFPFPRSPDHRSGCIQPSVSFSPLGPLGGSLRFRLACFKKTLVTFNPTHIQPQIPLAITLTRSQIDSASLSQNESWIACTHDTTKERSYCALPYESCELHCASASIVLLRRQRPIPVPERESLQRRRRGKTLAFPWRSSTAAALTHIAIAVTLLLSPPDHPRAAVARTTVHSAPLSDRRWRGRSQILNGRSMLPCPFGSLRNDRAPLLLLLSACAAKRSLVGFSSGRGFSGLPSHSSSSSSQHCCHNPSCLPARC